MKVKQKNKQISDIENLNDFLEMLPNWAEKQNKFSELTAEEIISYFRALIDQCRQLGGI